MSDITLARRKRTSVLAIVFALTCMTALVAVSPELYRVFCQVTGFGGTPQIAAEAPGAGEAPDVLVTVRFNADTGRGMPWEFHPMQREVTARLGEQVTVFYEATNPTDHAVTGTATFNVTPDKAGPYFAKIACFCFTEQTLEPGQTVAMPVTFFVDPEIVVDRTTDEVRTITLSYTFFEKVEATDSAALVTGTASTTN